MLINDFFEDASKDPCWKGYKQIGMKEKSGKQVPNCVPKSQTTNEVEQRFDEPLTGWHIVYRSSGNPVHGTPSFESKDDAQKFLMTKLFKNHHQFKVVHTAHVGISEAQEVLLWEEQEEDLRQELLKNPQLFENNDAYKSLKNFLDINVTKHSTHGKSYVYASVVSILPAHSLSIANFAQPHKLIKIENNRAYFEINGEVKVYPEGSDLSGDLLKTTFLFPNIDEFEKFQTMLQLKFGDWNIKNKIIEGTNVRESDISGVMHAAKHLNKSFIISAELAEGGKKTFRVRAQSERVAREKFSQHYSMAKILSVKEEGVTEGAPELLKAEMPLVRHIERELTQHGYEKGTEEFNKMFNHSMAFYRKFGNVDLIKKQGMAEGSGGNWYIRINGKILKDKNKVNAIPFASEDEARSHAMKLADKKRIPLSQIKLTNSWMDAPEQGVAESTSADLKKKISKYEELALAANRAGDDEKCKLYQRKIQALKQKMSQTAERAVEQKQLDEKWSKKYKDSIGCSNPEGFGQRAHCANEKKNESVTEDQATNPTDKITCDVPLLIRLLEYAREDAKTDMDLHDVTERLIALSAEGRTLSMQDYDAIVTQQGEMTEAKSLAKRVRIVKGPHAGKTGHIREIKHGAFKGAPKSYFVDLDGGGQANNLPGTDLRLIKDIKEGMLNPGEYHEWTGTFDDGSTEIITQHSENVKARDLAKEQYPNKTLVSIKYRGIGNMGMGSRGGATGAQDYHAQQRGIEKAQQFAQAERGHERGNK